MTEIVDDDGNLVMNFTLPLDKQETEEPDKKHKGTHQAAQIGMLKCYKELLKGETERQNLMFCSEIGVKARNN